MILAQLAGGGSSGLTTILFFGALFLIMYFIMIRPQQKQVQQHKALIASLKKGDDVITNGGMLGKIYAVTDKLVTLEVANGVRIRVLKSSVQGKSNLTEEAAAPAKAEEKKEEK